MNKHVYMLLFLQTMILRTQTKTPINPSISIFSMAAAKRVHQAAKVPNHPLKVPESPHPTITLTPTLMTSIMMTL